MSSRLLILEYFQLLPCFHNIFGRRKGTDELVTFSSRFVEYPRWCFDGRHFLFTRDREEKGNTHIFCADLISGGTMDLTPDVKSRADLLEISSGAPHEALITGGFIRNGRFACGSDV